MKYCFDFKMQAMYGIISFLIALAIIFVFTKEINWIAPSIIGLVEFIVSGYFIGSKCKK